MIRIAWTGLCWEVRRGRRACMRRFRGKLCGTFRPVMLGKNWTGKWAVYRRVRDTRETHTTSFLEAARFALLKGKHG